MRTNIRGLRPAAILLALFACNAFAQSTADEKPAPSLYDQFPECMNRGQVAAGQPAPCELPAPPTDRRPRAPLGSNVVGEAGPAQGTALRSINSSTPSASGSTAQGQAAANRAGGAR